MGNSEQMLNKLIDDLKKSEEIVNNLESYNRKCSFFKILLKISLILHKSIPFVLSLVIMGSFLSKVDAITNKEKTVYATLGKTVTSSGYERSVSTYDDVEEQEMFYHTTGWVQNDQTGLWSRSETVYSLNLPKTMALENYEEILSMSKEEVESLVKVTDYREITKKYLTEEDHLYDEDAIVITFYTDDLSTFKIVPIDALDIIGRILLYAMLSAILGAGFKVVVKYVFKEFRIPEKISELELGYRTYTVEERNKLAELLELRKSSLSIFDEKETSMPLDGSKVYSLTFNRERELKNGTR